MFFEVLGDLLTEHGTLDVRGAKVDSGPYTSVDDLLKRLGEPVEAPSGTRFVTDDAEGDLVGAEEVLKRIDKRTCHGGMAGWVIRERRGDK